MKRISLNKERIIPVLIMGAVFAMVLLFNQPVYSADRFLNPIQVRPVAHSGEESHAEAGGNVMGSSGTCPQLRKTSKAPDNYLSRKNPLKPTRKNLLAGKGLFIFDAKPTPCKVCHGFKGNGMGILHSRLIPRPRNFTCYYTMENLPDGQLFWVIKNGSPGTAMPSFSYLEDDQVWQLILYIRQFQK